MEKSKLEKALEQLPSYTQQINNLGEPGFDLPDIYLRLKTVEKAYQQLQQAGVDVKDQLKERRYQIAELVAKIIFNEAEMILHYTEGRFSEGSPGEPGGDIESCYKAITGSMGVLGKYLGKLYSGKYDPENTEVEKKLYPEPE